MKTLLEVEVVRLNRTLRFIYSSLHGYFNLSVCLSHQSTSCLMTFRLMEDPVKEGRTVADCYHTASSTCYQKGWEQMLRYMSLEGDNKELDDREIRNLLGGWNISPSKFRGMLECKGRVTDQESNHNYPSPADLRRMMGAGMPEADFLIHQELFKNEMREIINIATNEMMETQVMVQNLISTVEEFKVQLSQMAAIKPLAATGGSSAPLVPRADPKKETCAVVRPGRKPRTPRGFSSRSNSSRTPSRTPTPVNQAGQITKSVGQITTSHPDIYELFQIPHTNTSVEVPMEAATPVDPFKSDEDD